MKIHLLVHHVIVEDAPPRQAYIQFSEQHTHQVFQTHSGPTDGTRWEKDIITFSFKEINLRSTINIKLIDAQSNIQNSCSNDVKLSENLDSDFINHRKSGMIVRKSDDIVVNDLITFDQSSDSNSDDSQDSTHEITQSHSNMDIENDINTSFEQNFIKCDEKDDLEIAELPLPLNIIPFDKRVNSKFLMISKRSENLNTNSKVKLFLIIHLSTFGQLPFHAAKGTLLKHLKDATRASGKTPEKEKMSLHCALEGMNQSQKLDFDTPCTTREEAPQRKLCHVAKAGSCSDLSSQGLLADILVT
ncbi:hypothetical protein TRFO_38439 [Tritrichomonas foetus]|uniref:Uncharacterized protein n=1 Tax=Tritrichomonas foetus TaxID=1144522 RepID=A0A1J4JDH3_9EUKA|nr:hypothetical protein TRFO_38439 [Tritrichomonas foetus]|eukprot:OHS95485.1 hypothetical protein TRFO_38439 [Tritrichomonas foetus]